MKKLTLSLISFSIVAGVCFPATAQVSSTANGGSGGAGGTASGGMATGGTSTNTNTTTGGTSSATGGAANIGSATSNYQGGADVSVNYITPAGAAGVNGLAPGVDPATNHFVNDTNFRTSGTTKIKNTPDVNLGGPASGACNGLSGGVGVGIPGLAVGGNISTVDKGCEARETARVAAMLGRMDVANAILENMDVVVSALKAKNDRAARETEQSAAAQAQAQRANTANAAIAQAQRAQDAELVLAQQAAREREAEAMRVQQQAGVEALARQATMAKVNDTLTFTGKLTQGEEKTPQQRMAEELEARQASERRTAEAERLAADAKATSDIRSSPMPVVASAARVAQSGVADGKVPPSSPASPSKRVAPDRKRLPADDKSDAQAAVRFALGLSD